MLASRYVLFTAVEGALVDSASRLGAGAEEALEELARRNVQLILSSTGTRAQLEPVRRKLEHVLPFVTESGGGLFLPDGYFNTHLEGARRVARYFCIPFGRDYAAACAALEEIAAESKASVVGYSQMNAREIASNTGLTPREAEPAAQREFSERFFFAGDAEAVWPQFAEAARKRGWQVTPPVEGKGPFLEFSSGNDAGRAVQTLMKLYRTSLRLRLSSIGIGSTAEHLPLLRAVDHAILLPERGKEIDGALRARLPKARVAESPGAAGWNEAVLQFLEESFESAGKGAG